MENETKIIANVRDTYDGKKGHNVGSLVMLTGLQAANDLFVANFAKQITAREEQESGALKLLQAAKPGTDKFKQLEANHKEYAKSTLTAKKAMETVLKQISGEKPHLPLATLAMIEKYSHKLAEATLELYPSLNRTPQLHRGEVGDMWDAGLIASDDDRPCFDFKNDGECAHTGKGDGAFRFVINTDTSFGRSDGENMAVSLALFTILQTFAPVEVWIQQGWLSSNCGETEQHKPNMSSGMTIFRVGAGTTLSAAQLAFWFGSPNRDSPYSRQINSELGRVYGGCASSCALPHDIYTRNACWNEMPTVNFMAPTHEELYSVATWLGKELERVVYHPEMTDV